MGLYLKRYGLIAAALLEPPTLTVFKAIVQMRHGDRSDKETLMSIYGILFFGVPHRGMMIEQWLEMVKDQPNKTLIKTLAPGSSYLKQLHKDFQRAFGYPDSKSRIISFFETEESRIAKVSTRYEDLRL